MAQGFHAKSRDVELRFFLDHVHQTREVYRETSLFSGTRLQQRLLFGWFFSQICISYA
jgi:hypothetical protein